MTAGIQLTKMNFLNPIWLKSEIHGEPHDTPNYAHREDFFFFSENLQILEFYYIV